METARNRSGGGSGVALLRLGLAAFVLLWLLGPVALRSAVPIWAVFLIALGLEAHFFLGALRRRAAPASRPDRLPQPVDRERYGYAADPGELVLVRREGEELWIPYAGEDEDELERLIAAARERPEPEPRAAPARQRRRPVRQLVLGLGVIGALALVVWLVETRGGWDGLDPERRAEAAERFSTEASRIAGHRVAIRCDESGDYVGAVQHADGVAAVGGRLAYLTPRRCHDLYRLAFEGEVTPSQTARALAVLAHEAWHLHGIRDEGTTECYALQSAVEIGRRFGLDEATARQMMRQQLVENTLHARSSPEYLVPPDCRDGGALDLDPRSSAFP